MEMRDRETLAMQNSNISNNHWSFRYNWQGFQNMYWKNTDGKLLQAFSEILRNECVSSTSMLLGN